MDETTDLRARLVAAARAELTEHGYGRVSLRAVARRAGVSHAAPAYAFGDRAGLLTEVVAQGFRDLAAQLDAPVAAEEVPLAALGRRYVAFARQHPALYDLMFRPDELDADDADLAAARQSALTALVVATSGGAPAPTELTVISWALAHGLATLAGQGAIDVIAPGRGPDDLIETYARLVTAAGDAPG